MVNSKYAIPLCESMRASHHTSVDTHLGYTEPDEEAHSKRYREMASKTISDDDKMVRYLFVLYFYVKHYLTHFFVFFISASWTKRQRLRMDQQ